MFDRHELDDAVRLQQIAFRVLWSDTARHTRFLHKVLFSPFDAHAPAVASWMREARAGLLAELRPDITECDLDDERLALMLTSFRYTVSEIPITADRNARSSSGNPRKGRENIHRNREAARYAKIAAMRALCEHLDLPLIEQELADFVDADVPAGDIAWVAYGRELLRRAAMHQYEAFFRLTGRSLPGLWTELRANACQRGVRPTVSTDRILHATKRVSEVLRGRYRMD